MNVHEINLDVSKQPAVTPVLHLGQGDKNGTTLQASIYDDGVPLSLSGKSVRFAMRSPNGQAYYEVNGTVSGNVATFQINEEYAAGIAGTTDVAYVEVLEGSTVVCSTNRFRVVILESAQEGADPEQAYSNGIFEAIDDAHEAADDARDAAEEAREAAGGTIPLMSSTQRGGAKLGTGLEVDSSEKLNVKPATTSSLGGVKADGTTITVDPDGTLHGSSSYTLPTMSPTTKGGAKVGHGLSMDGEALNLGPLTDSGSGASVQTDGCGIFGVTGEGFAHQDGTPTPDSPQEIRVARGRNLLDTSSMSESVYNTIGTSNWSPSAYGYSTLFVPIEPGVEYVSSGFNGTVGGVGSGFVASDKRTVVGTSVNSKGNNKSWGVAPDGAAYLFLGVHSSDDLSKAQLEQGSTATPYVPYGHIGLDVTANGQTTTTPIPLPSKGFAAKIGDYADTLEVDSAGGYVWTNDVGESHTVSSYDGSNANRSNFVVADNAIVVSNSVVPTAFGTHWKPVASSATWYPGDFGITGVGVVKVAVSTSITTTSAFMSAFPSFMVMYPLKAPTTEQGYIALPELPNGATVSIPELETIGVEWWVEGAEAMAEHGRDTSKAAHELSDKLSTLEAAVATLATS